MTAIARKSGHRPKAGGRRPKTPKTGSGVMKAKQPGTAVMIRQEGNTPTSATSTMVALAQSKDFDAEKFKVMAEFQQNMVAQQSKLDFNADFHAMQAELPSIAQDGKIVIRDKNDKSANPRVIQSTPYATFPNIMKVVKPILQVHNFTLNYTIATEPDGKPTVTGILYSTRGSHSQTSTMTLPMDTTGSKNNVQGVGSAVAYAKRYIAIGLLNLISHAPEDKDDDGAGAGDAGMAPIDGRQFTALNDKIEEVKADKRKFCDHFGISGIAKLPQKSFDTAMKLLEQKARQTTKGKADVDNDFRV